MGHVVARGLRAPTPGMLLKSSPQSSQAWCLYSSDYTSAPRAQCDAIIDGSPMALPSSVHCGGQCVPQRRGLGTHNRHGSG